VILSHKPTTWEGLFTALEGAKAPQDFLCKADRAQGIDGRDPLEGWRA